MAKKKVWVVGHKHPDTDSICAAISYANLKNEIEKKNPKASTGMTYIAKRAGSVNAETAYVLERFHAKAPAMISDVGTQIKDIQIRRTEGVNSHISMKKAWEMMKILGVVTLPVVRENKLEGLIVTGDIAKSYMDVYDNTILSTARTQYKNIVETLDGQLLTGNEHAYFVHGKVVIGIGTPEGVTSAIDKDDLVMIGDGEESQMLSIASNCSCMIVTNGYEISQEVIEAAKEREVVLISTPYDTFTAARLINQSMPISFFMKTENLITFDTDDYIDDIKEVMASKRHRDFPILDKNGKYKGMISRRNLLGARGKNVILVDHNERSQAVDGMENANILEIIDHHRLGTVETMGPVFFRNQPLGCTATIIYQMYKEAGVTIENKIAGLLCSAIISDTLLFRSPTCTPVDKDAAMKLAAIAGIDVEQLANKMFAAGSKLKGKSDAEIFYQDFKRFTAGKIAFGVGQITSLNAGELNELKSRMLTYMDRAREDEKVDMMFFMLTNILTESTELICDGQGAKQLAGEAFHLGDEEMDKEEHIVSLPGVVSRKKQLVPGLMVATEQ